MPRVPAAAIVSGAAPEGSTTVAERIAVARRRQMARSGELNGRARGRELRAACDLRPVAAARAVELGELEQLSGRGTERLLRVARTIADLDCQPRVEPAHLDEAARYRLPASRLAQRLAS